MEKAPALATRIGLATALLALGCATVGGPSSTLSKEVGSSPAIELAISDVRTNSRRRVCYSLGRRMPTHALGFECVITVVNNTGKTLNVTTDYASPFEAMFLVATFPDGTEGYRHRPDQYKKDHSPGKAFPLPPGETTRTVTFPDWPWPWEGPETVEVTLVGGLPGTDYTEGLASNTVTVTIPGPPE